eukprot:s2614_g17.t1
MPTFWKTTPFIWRQPAAFDSLTRGGGRPRSGKCTVKFKPQTPLVAFSHVFRDAKASGFKHRMPLRELVSRPVMSTRCSERMQTSAIFALQLLPNSVMDTASASSSQDSPILAPSRCPRSGYDAGRQKELQVLGLMALEVRAVSWKLRHLGMAPDTEVAVKNAREVHELLSTELARLSHEMKDGPRSLRRVKDSKDSKDSRQRWSFLEDLLETTAESRTPTSEGGELL